VWSNPEGYVFSLRNIPKNIKFLRILYSSQTSGGFLKMEYDGITHLNIYNFPELFILDRLNSKSYYHLSWREHP